MGFFTQFENLFLQIFLNNQKCNFFPSKNKDFLFGFNTLNLFGKFCLMMIIFELNNYRKHLTLTASILGLLMHIDLDMRIDYMHKRWAAVQVKG